MPLFPPSYKRKKGDEEGDCGNYTDTAKILKGFTNTGEMEEPAPAFSSSSTFSNSSDNARQSIELSVLTNDDTIGSNEYSNASFKSSGRMSPTGSNSAKAADRTSKRLFSLGLDTSAVTEKAATDINQLSNALSTALSPSNLRESFNLVRKQIDPRVLRPPSYTDRILFHSLPDQESRLTVQAYDLCDQLRVSDHRAVSMVVLLEVKCVSCTSFT